MMLPDYPVKKECGVQMSQLPACCCHKHVQLMAYSSQCLLCLLCGYTCHLRIVKLLHGVAQVDLMLLPFD